MIYQVRATLFFDDADEAGDFYHDCENALPKATVVNPLTQNQECSCIELLKNHHDENPPSPCRTIEFDHNCPSPPE